MRYISRSFDIDRGSRIAPGREYRIGEGGGTGDAVFDV